MKQNSTETIPVDIVENPGNADNKADGQNDPYEVIADVRYKIKGKTEHLVFTRREAEKVRNIYPGVDLKTEAARMQIWFDKPEQKNVNLHGESMNNFLNRWFAKTQAWGGSKAIESDDDFDFDKFLEYAVLKEREKL